MESTFRPLFIGGHRKAGTSLFHTLFDGHPDLLVYPTDLNVLYAYFPVYERGKFTPAEKRNRLNCVLFEDMARDRTVNTHIDVERFEQCFWRRMGKSDCMTKEVLQSLFDAYHEVRGLPKCQWIVVKETSIEIYAYLLFEWFPRSMFFHLIRDPRDNYAALKAGVHNYYHQFGDTEKTLLHSLLTRCHLGMRLADINKRRFGAKQYRVFDFNDVVLQPKKTMMRACRLLGVPYNSCLLQPTTLETGVYGNNFDGKRFSRIASDNVGRWPERITPEEAKIIEFYFHDLMAKYGYQFAFSEEEQADAASSFYEWVNYTYHFVDRFERLDIVHPASA